MTTIPERYRDCDDDDDGPINRTLRALVAAKADAKEKRFSKGHGGADSLPCPICTTGRLYYSVASVNGHMHARCETDGCVSWME